MMLPSGGKGLGRRFPLVVKKGTIFVVYFFKIAHIDTTINEVTKSDLTSFF